MKKLPFDPVLMMVILRLRSNAEIFDMLAEGVPNGYDRWRRMYQHLATESREAERELRERLRAKEEAEE